MHWLQTHHNTLADRPCSERKHTRRPTILLLQRVHRFIVNVKMSYSYRQYRVENNGSWFPYIYLGQCNIELEVYCMRWQNIIKKLSFIKYIYFGSISLVFRKYRSCSSL